MNNVKKQKIIEIFSTLYPDPKSELAFKNNYQLIVSVVLSAQCTDKKVNEVTPLLFKKFSDFKSLSMAKVSPVEEIIRPVNYYKTKARNLVALAKKVQTEHQGQVPKSFEEAIQLPGVGRKTASVVLGEMGLDFTLPVDTHVFRLANRLGLSAGKNPVAVETDLKSLFPKELWRPLHHWLILHGRRICKARAPLCAECALNKICPSAP